MFGIEKKVARVRDAMIKALQAKAVEIMQQYADKKPDQIPKDQLARAQVLMDLAGILTNLSIEKHPDDDKDG